MQAREQTVAAPSKGRKLAWISTNLQKISPVNKSAGDFLAGSLAKEASKESRHAIPYHIRRHEQ